MCDKDYFHHTVPLLDFLNIPIFNTAENQSPHASSFQSDYWNTWEQNWYRNNSGVLQQADDLLNDYVNRIQYENETKGGRQRKRKRKGSKKSSQRDEKAAADGHLEVAYESTPVKGKPRPSHDDIIEDIDNVLDLAQPQASLESSIIEKESLKVNKCESKLQLHVQNVDMKFEAYEIWKKKYRQLVEEEYPDSSQNEIEEKLKEIWDKIPNAHRKKYYKQAYKELIDNKNTESTSNSKSKTRENVLQIVKPIPLKADRYTGSDEESSGNSIDSGDDRSHSYRECMRECPTFHSSDRWMKRRVEAKRNVSQTKVEESDINEENKIATGYLQDLMLSSMSENKNEDDLSYVDLSEDILKSSGVDLNELSQYLSSESMHIHCQLDVDELATLIEETETTNMNQPNICNFRVQVKRRQPSISRVMYITDFPENSQNKTYHASAFMESARQEIDLRRRSD